MAFQTIDLTNSDDEEQSPNQQAQAALHRFAPRKNRDSEKEALRAGGCYGDEGDLLSPERAARSGLDSFAPRKNGEHGISKGLDPDAAIAWRAKADRGQGQTAASSGSTPTLRKVKPGNEDVGAGRHQAKAKDDRRQQSYLQPNGLPGPPSTSSPKVGTSGGHARQPNSRNGQVKPTNASITKLPQITGTAPLRTRPEEGSLAAILQKDQEPDLNRTATFASRPSWADKSLQVEERERRANAFLEQSRQQHAATSPDMQPAKGEKSTPKTFDDGMPQFCLPTGWSSSQGSLTRHTNRPIETPLTIVDQPENTDDAAPQQGLLNIDIESPPFKRPRLSSPSPRNHATSVPGPHKLRKEDSPLAAHHNDGPSRQFNGGRGSLGINMSLQSKGSASGHEQRNSAASKGRRESAKRKGARPWHTRHRTLLKPDIPAEPLSTKQQTTISPNCSPVAGSKSHSSTIDRTSTVQDVRKTAESSSEKKPSQSSRPSLQASLGASSNFGNQYTPEEDALLAELKEIRNMRWDEMIPYFKGRTKGSLQVRYSTKIRHRHQHARKATSLERVRKGSNGEDSDSEARGQTQRKRRNAGASVAAGMISWEEARKRRNVTDDGHEASEAPCGTPETRLLEQFAQERAHPQVFSRILRQRELGMTSRACCKPVSDELKEHIFDNVGPLKYHKGTSGDVTCISWSPHGQHFAAGSIAISDDRSMQYNRPGNLIFGDGNLLQELPDHHVARPAIASKDNVNGLHAMRESQDPRLFMTVATVEFSPDGRTLYSAGTDAKVRAFTFGDGKASCAYEIEHRAPLDLLSVSKGDVLATACHSSADGSIGIYQSGTLLHSLSPSRIDQQTNRAIFPSALRWGISHYHSNLLLAGFSIDSIDEERDIAGETCLWNVTTQQALRMPVTRNVFDLAWNPHPTSSSTTFAIASTPGTQKVTRGTRTVVQCFALNQERASRVLEWECPAFDINDVMYCQHDDNLIAAGTTDGKVYVWDQRFAGRKPTPLHVLEHSESLNVLDHDRPREIADTGVRFLSWGATSSRLYTGSSDGTVKIWNPYMATENAHIKDVATFGSAVMSGAFSPDYRDLLIGEDQGRINLLSVGHDQKAVRSMRKFEYTPAPPPEMVEDRFGTAHQLLDSREIVLKPMGDLPILQAVQGPNYAGPYLAPTDKELQQAQRSYHEALHTQRELRSRIDMRESPSQLSRDADHQVQQAQEALAKLQSRIFDADKLHPQATAHQARLHRANKQRFRLELSLSHEVERCKLDCNYLPANVDDDGDVADSGRSAGRIPGALRLPPPTDTMQLTSEELLETGLTKNCVACAGPAAKPKSGLPVCDLCATVRRGLTAKCARCSSPIRPQTESSGQGLCEGCGFACFRCSGPALVAADKSSIRCNACDLTWTTGVLGYELAVSSKPPRQNEGRRAAEIEDRELEFGEEEMERYARRWGST